MSLLTPIKGRIRSEKLDPAADIRDLLPTVPQVLSDFTRALEDIDVLCLRGRPGHFFSFTGFSARQQVPLLVNRWLNDAVVTHKVGPKLAENSGIIASDVDPRIRPFTVEEREVVRSWLKLNQEIEALTKVALVRFSSFVKFDRINANDYKSKTLQETVDLTSELSRKGKDLELPFNPDDKFLKSLGERITGLKAKQDAVTPQWWKEWRHVSP